MKKLAAIFFFTLLLFNIIGYQMIFFYAQQQSNIQLESSLDKNDYNESELVAIKVPLSLPYMTNQSEFERVDGEISLDGKVFKYVKCKMTEGNLILLCLPDHNQMRLTKEKNNFFKDANSLAQNTGSKQDNAKGNCFKNLSIEYDQYQPSYSTSSLSPPVCCFTSTTEPKLTSMPDASPEQPPELT